MRILVGILLFVVDLPSALACSCGPGEPFLTKAYRAELVVLGTVLAHQAHGMDFRIEAVYRGAETRDVIRAWGDEGASCRPYTSTFATGSRWVLTLQRSAGSIDGESTTDYAVQGCGEAYLAVSGDSVYLSDRQERWRLDRLVDEIALLDRMPPPMSGFEIERNRLRDLLLSGESGSGLASPASPPSSASQAAAECQSLTRLAVDGASISAAEPIAAGGLDPPIEADESIALAYRRLPSICRVEGFFAPTRDVILPFELWMPLQSWNGESTGLSTPLAAGRPDLVSAVGAGPLARGGAVFALVSPASESNAGDYLARFRGIVERMRSSPVHAPRSFLGNTSMYTGRLNPSRPPARNVPRGPGRIEGRVTLHGQPVIDLRLRLAMDVTLWSPWLSTDSNGRYSFDLPYGEYSIDGFQIDPDSADRLLPGTIDFPGFVRQIDPLTVDGGGPAQGPEFRYVYPVRIQWPVGAVTVDQARQIVWNPYPGADRYTVRIDRRDGPSIVNGLRTSWAAEGLAGTSVVLPQSELFLAPGTYHILVWAIDAGGTAIAAVPGYRGVEFQIVE